NQPPYNLADIQLTTGLAEVIFLRKLFQFLLLNFGDSGVYSRHYNSSFPARPQEAFSSSSFAVISWRRYWMTLALAALSSISATLTSSPVSVTKYQYR